MTEIINAVLHSRQFNSVRRGQIVTGSEPQTVAIAVEAMRAFLAFGGEGWLCTTESRAILYSAPGGTWPPPESAWPLHGELTKEDGGRKLSLHLRRTPQGWSLVWLEETAGDGAESCLVDSTLHSHSQAAGIRLRYVTAWTPVWIGDERTGHAELRPTACRFAGFETTQ